MNTSDKNIRLQVKDPAELEKCGERRAFDAALKKTDIGAVQARSEREFFLCQACCFSATTEVRAKDFIELGQCIHTIRYQYL